MRGEMLWFNEIKDVGCIVAEGGERLSVRGSGFAPGERPVGRCAGRAVEFGLSAGADDSEASEVFFPPEMDTRRARIRHGGGARLR